MYDDDDGIFIGIMTFVFAEAVAMATMNIITMAVFLIFVNVVMLDGAGRMSGHQE